jgi:sugar/nucleoside kinase (ribokinase family)
MSSKQLDVLVVGDVLTDAFIKLLDDQAWTSHGDNGPILSMPFGMKVPFDHAEVIYGVGNSSNAAVSLTKLGHSAGLVANIGSDDGGRDILRAYHDHGVDTRFVHVNHDKKTNFHYVLWYKDDRTILINHEHYEYQWPRFKPHDVPKWMYLTSIGANTLEYHDEIAEFLAQNPNVKLLFQPGTFQISTGAERFARLYEHTELVVINREEAVLITGGSHEDMHDLLNRMHKLGPKIVAISDGPNGAFVSDGENRFTMPLYPDPAPPVERTGAGDAFASTLLAGLLHGLTLEDAIRWAPINSMNVVQHVGAQSGLLNTEQIMELLRNAPEWYKPERF